MFPDSWRPFAPDQRLCQKPCGSHHQSERYDGISTPRAAPLRYPGLLSAGQQRHPTVNGKESDGSESSRYLPGRPCPHWCIKTITAMSWSPDAIVPSTTAIRISPLLQASPAQGVSSTLTLYSGMQYADRYVSYIAGAGLNFHELGSFSTDATRARYTSYAENYRGSVWRLRYTRTFSAAELTLAPCYAIILRANIIAHWRRKSPNLPATMTGCLMTAKPSSDPAVLA